MPGALLSGRNENFAVMFRMLLGSWIWLSLAVMTVGGAEARTDFHGFVNWNFHHRKSLVSWRATATAIQRTLAQWYPGRSPHTLVENGSPAALGKFFHGLPAGSDCDFSIVYLASHQSPAGEWDFVTRQMEPLSRLATASDIPGHPARIVIVDACFAAAVQRAAAWERAWRSGSLFAASDAEETQELNFRSPQPIDLRRRYPEAAAWLRENMGREWDGRLSFLGFVWVQTFVTSPAAPGDLKSWGEFLRGCEKTAKQFRENGDRRIASRIVFAPATNSPPPISARRQR